MEEAKWHHNSSTCSRKCSSVMTTDFCRQMTTTARQILFLFLFWKKNLSPSYIPFLFIKEINWRKEVTVDLCSGCLQFIRCLLHFIHQFLILNQNFLVSFFQKTNLKHWLHVHNIIQLLNNHQLVWCCSLFSFVFSQLGILSGCALQCILCIVLLNARVLTNSKTCLSSFYWEKLSVLIDVRC